jgi:hypothetical protein
MIKITHNQSSGWKVWHREDRGNFSSPVIPFQDIGQGSLSVTEGRTSVDSGTRVNEKCGFIRVANSSIIA